MTDKARQKDIAMQCLKKLNINGAFISCFQNKGMPCFFENYAGFYINQEPDIYEKVKAVEEAYEYLVYAITHELTDYGETWTMLCITDDMEDVDQAIETFSDEDYYAFAYVWNKSNPIFSEFGDVIVRSYLGGLKRIH